MKKILFFFLITLLTVTTNAQINKNAVLLGGDISFGTGKTSSSSTSTDQKSNNGSISLSLGKAIKENQVVGFNVGYFGQRTTNMFTGSDTATTQINGFEIGFFYRQYKMLAKDFYVFGQANALYRYSTSTSDYKLNPGNNYKVNQNVAAVSVTPGLAYKIFKKTFVELSLINLASLSYSNAKNIHKDYTQKSNNVSLTTAFSNNSDLGSVGIGFRFIL